MPKSRSIALPVGWVILLVAASFAQQATISTAPPEPIELVRKAVENQIKALQNDDAPRFLFRGTKTTPRGSTTKAYIQTRKTTAGIVVAYNGKPLTPEQRQAEETRVERFITSPEELSKKQRQEQEDTDRSLRVLKALPEAFLFEYAPEQKESESGTGGHKEVLLNFRPNPQYDPPSRIEQVLVGMQGTVLLDPVRNRLVAIDGTLFRDVAFGWGFLGHLDKGGHVLLEQQEIGSDRWAYSKMNLNFTGKILLVKSLAVNTTEVYSDFRQVPPDLTFPQAIEMLKKEQAVAADSSSAKASSQ